MDICETRTVICWRVSPEPNVPSLFPEDFESLEEELGGVDDAWAADELRKNSIEALMRERVYVFQLRDDIGTHYQQTRHTGHYGSAVATGSVTLSRPYRS